MTLEDIIRMAREAGLYQKPETYDAYRTEIERFAALVAAAEREACAKLCESAYDGSRKAYGEQLATAIRARGRA